MADEIKQHFIKYSGTKAEFIAKGYPATYTDKIVFIGNGECIYTRGMYFANFSELIAAHTAALNFVKGVTVGSDSYNAAKGGGYIAFEASTPAEVGLNVTNGKITIGLTAEFIASINTIKSDITNIKNNYATTSAMNTAIGNAKTELKGNTANAQATDETIAGAKKFAENVGNTVTTNLKGVYSTASQDDETIAGAKKYADEAGTGALNRAKTYTDEEINKVKGSSTDTSASKTIEGLTKLINEKTEGIASEGVVTGIDNRVKAIEDDYLKGADKTELQGAINTEKGRVDTLVGTDTNKSVRTISAEEVAKIVAGADANFDTLKEIADWIKSDTTGAAKMANDIADNKEAIEVLNGSDTTAGSVAKAVKDSSDTLRTWVYEGFGTKGEVAAKYTKPTNGIPKTDLASGVQTSLGKADTAYQKATTGIPKTDLANGVQGSLDKADSALQSVAPGDHISVTTKSNGSQTISVKKSEIIDGLATDANAQSYANTAESNAKSYADSQWEWLDLD